MPLQHLQSVPGSYRHSVVDNNRETDAIYQLLRQPTINIDEHPVREATTNNGIESSNWPPTAQPEFSRLNNSSTWAEIKTSVRKEARTAIRANMAHITQCNKGPREVTMKKHRAPNEPSRQSKKAMRKKSYCFTYEHFVSCQICFGNHQTAFYYKYLNLKVKDRRKMVRAKNIQCVCCLRNDHIARHHVTLCKTRQMLQMLKKSEQLKHKQKPQEKRPSYPRRTKVENETITSQINIKTEIKEENPFE